MGEKIRDVGKINLKGLDLEVELNKESILNGPRYIHIQNDKFRLSLTEKEYIQMVASVYRAQKSLKRNKGLED